jgi:xanthine dehydrogenase accessory factor
MNDSAEAVYEAALRAVRDGEGAALVTIVRAGETSPRGPGAKMLVYADGRTLGTVGGGPAEAWVVEQARQALAEGPSRLITRSAEKGKDVCAADLSCFVDVLLPEPTLLIVGAGHIGQAVASMGSWFGYRIVVLDERPSEAVPERFPDADALLCGSLQEELASYPLGEHVYVVLVTPHHSADEQALAVLQEAEVPYIGLLGGKRRTEATFRRARAIGVSDAFLETIHTPIGLDIGAETPREIALSILADVTAVRRGGR